MTAAVAWRQFGLRSRNGFDVSEVAKKFGGGGHAAAAGFVINIAKLDILQARQ
jgi:phosphoesterase RecJ-like protein